MSKLRPSAEEFKQYVQDKKVIILEAGVYRGYYSKELFKIFNCEKLYLLDQWFSEYEGGKYKVPNILDYAKTAMSFFDGCKNVIFIKSGSLSFDLWPDDYFDYVYLDNDHSYEHCVKEFPKYWYKVKSGGMISGDNLEAPGVKRALDEFSENLGIEYQSQPWKVNADNGTAIASDWWIWKK